MSKGTGQEFFGHPWGLSTLFFTEMWERFSYYGMRGLLVLYMVDQVEGMGVSDGFAGAVYGLYTFGVYALALPGGWIADRLIGKKPAVMYGGIIIAAGHFVLAVPNDIAFYIGLLLVMVGTGLLKPNVSAIVGDLYEPGDRKRDAGFSIFYAGINIGAILGPLICSYLGEEVDWHLGFGAAGVGMSLAVVWYMAGQKHLRGAGEISSEGKKPWAAMWIGTVLFFAVVAVLAGMVSGGSVDIVTMAQSTGGVIGIIVLAYLAYVLAFACKDNTERARIGACAALFIGAALFWSGFEQAGSTFNLFAENETNRMLGSFEVPAGWLQTVNPLWIVILAPIVGNLWVTLGHRNPSLGVKFFLGLFLLGVGFFVLAWGATYIDEGKVGMQWLVVTYFFHSVGELCLSPVGLSSITKLSPKRLVSQMMGLWFMGSAIGNLIAGLVTTFLDSDMSQSRLYSIVGINVTVAGVLFLVAAPLLRKMTKGAD